MSPELDAAALAAVLAEARQARAARPRGPAMIGLCGAQGSGKSTLAEAMGRVLSADGLSTAVLSLDDLYLAKSARQALARDVHPLFATRGVPGTHDVALGERLFAALDRGQQVRLPRFDKATDDRLPETDWPQVDPPLDLLIFEGWCVGARPESDAALAAPINVLEREEDRDGRWRRTVNTALAGPYRDLFARIDRLILLAAPSFEIVRRWRGDQEAALRRNRPSSSDVMDATTLDRFVQHYERITRHILRQMPFYADLTIHLDTDRRANFSSRAI